jgi:hypothetical protein
MSRKGTKRAFPGGADPSGREQLHLTSSELQARVGQKFCDEAELLPLLLAHGFVRRVRTIEVLVQPVGGDSFKVRLDCAKPSVGEVKAAIAVVQGTRESQQELYRVAFRADGGAVREDDAEPESLADDLHELEEGDVIAMAVKDVTAQAMTWQRKVNMRAEGMELEKIGGENYNFDAGCSSVETISRNENGQWVEWTVERTDKIYSIALSHDGAIDYAIYIYDDATFAAREKSVRVSGAYIRYAPGDRFKIVVTGDTVTFEQNDKMFYTSRKKPAFPLFIDSVFSTPGARVSDMKLCTV